MFFNSSCGTAAPTVMASGVDRGNNGEEETATDDENMDEPGGEETRTNEDQLTALFGEI